MNMLKCEYSARGPVPRLSRHRPWVPVRPWWRNYGSMNGEASVVSAQSFIFNDVTLRGFWLVKWFQRITWVAQQTLYAELVGLLDSGKLHARVHTTFPVERIQDAIVAATTGERDGKVLIVPKS